MTTPFRFTDDDNLIIPRRRFGQPPSQQGRRHGAIVLTGLPAIAGDAIAGDDGAGAQDITEPAVKTTASPTRLAPAPAEPEKTRARPAQEPVGEPTLEPIRRELEPQASPQVSDAQRRYDTRHTRAPSAEIPSPPQSDTLSSTPTGAKNRDLVGRWVSVLLTTLAIVGAILFLAGLLSSNRQPGPEAPMSDWNAGGPQTVVVTGGSSAPQPQIGTPSSGGSLDDLPAFNDSVMQEVDRPSPMTTEFYPQKVSHTVAGQRGRDVSVADLASSPIHPEPTLATVDVPTNGPLERSPETLLHQQLLEEQSVLSEDTTDKELVDRMSVAPRPSDIRTPATDPQGIHEFDYPVTDPSSYRPPPVSNSMVTPQQPGTARLNGSIHNYRRPR